MMTDEEIYEFDIRGYLILRNALLPEDVLRICNILANANVHPAEDSGKFTFMELDPYFLELMAHPRTVSVLKTILGDWLRFDHAFGVETTKSLTISSSGLQGGLLKQQRSFWYQWVPNKGMHNGLVKVVYALSDTDSGDGGFVCIPGSHKGNVDYCPPLDSHLVINPSMRSGDVLIFTEALVRGTRQWTANHARRALIYSYSPGFLGWKNYETIKHYLSLAANDIQRELLRPPYVGDYDEHESNMTGIWPGGRRTKIS